MRSKNFKKVLVVGIVAVTLAAGGYYLLNPAEKTSLNNAELIRLHIIANSDTDADQALKRRVRDAVLEAFSESFRRSGGMDEARRNIKNNLQGMRQVAVRQIEQDGFQYPVSVQYGLYDFPAKAYGEVTLPAGKYEAVRVIIGDGAGANWWCVLFPPLCFVDLSKDVAHTGGEPTVPAMKNIDTTNRQQIEIRFKALELWQRYRHKGNNPGNKI